MSDKLRKAIQTIQAGDKRRGHQLLIDVLKADPENATAWLWMSAVVNKERRRQVLERVLEIDPHHEIARQALSNLEEVAGRAPLVSSISKEVSTEVEVATIEQPHERATKRCPYCAETIKAEAIICRFCGRDLIVPPKEYHREPKKNKGSHVVGNTDKTTSNVTPSVRKPPVLAGIVVIGLLFLACCICALISTGNGISSRSSTSPTRVIPATYTPRGSGQQSPPRQSEDDPPGIGYIWLENNPNTPVPVIDFVHDRFPVDVEELTRWILFDEACLADPGTRAYIEDYGLIKIEVTVQEGICAGYNGWIVSEAWQQYRP